MNWLLKQLNAVFQWFVDTFWPKQAFSWQTVFWLSMFSWGLTWLSINNVDAGLLESGSPSSSESQSLSRQLVGTSRVLFTMAWIFLTVAIGWVLAGRKWNIPILAITLKPSVWVTSALTSLFLFEIWNPETWPWVFIAWPIIFAIYTVLPKIVQVSTGRFTLPPPPMRQQLVISTLICLVMSCLFRFHFKVQNWIAREYQVLQLVNFDRGGVMQQVTPPSPILDVANLTLQNELGRFSIPEVRRWMLRTSEGIPTLNEAFRENLIRTSGTSAFWRLDVVVDTVSVPKFELFTWPTRDDVNIGLQQACRVVTTASLSDQELEARIQTFSNLPIRSGRQPTPSSNSTTTEDAVELPEFQSLISEVWERLSEFLDDVIPFDDQQELPNQQEAPDADQFLNPGSDFPLPSNSLPLNEQPSQVLCDPPNSLVRIEDENSDPESEEMNSTYLLAPRFGLLGLNFIGPDVKHHQN